MYFEGLLFISWYEDWYSDGLHKHMKTVIIYEVFYIFEGIYFWKLRNSECLALEIYSKYNP